MRFVLNTPVAANSLCHGLSLGLPSLLSGTNIHAVAPFATASPGDLTFSVKTPQVIEKGVIAFTPPSEALDGLVIVSDNPRLDFIRALTWLQAGKYFAAPQLGSIHSTAEIHPEASISASCHISENCVVGKNSTLMAGVCLGKNVKIGNNCTLGHDGFGFERDSEGVPHRFPHLGGVELGNGVEIGNSCTIARGTLGNTVIGDDSKVDDHCYIAHNVNVGQRVLIMAGVRLNGRVRIENSCWLGTNALVREGRCIGESALVGMGSVVVTDVEPKTTVLGNPAK